LSWITRKRAITYSRTLNAPSSISPSTPLTLKLASRRKLRTVAAFLAGFSLVLSGAFATAVFVGDARFTVVRVIAVGLVLYAGAQIGRFYVRKYYLFLPDYVRWATTSAPAVHGPTHVFVLFTDHFEPPHEWQSQRWVAEYIEMASRHRDTDGRHPQHTFFFPIEQPFDPHMHELGRLVSLGLGEVEVHLHHNFDTPEGLEQKIRDGLAYFERFGFSNTVDGQTRFGFVHGLSGLDNSNGDSMCGVERELELLRKMGCFADFTFPSIWEDSQPPFVNSIYEAVDDDGPKSYRQRLASMSLGTGDLTIFQGPLLMVPSLNPLRLFLEVEDGNIHAAKPARPKRVDRWIRANVHLPGRPDWVFVKLFGHTASSDADQYEMMGPNFDGALSYLEQRYNDGERYVLHYVTAREAYNLARAADAGLKGEPSDYYDWIIKPYVSSAPRRGHATNDRP
jgi:hypothetical protein